MCIYIYIYQLFKMREPHKQGPPFKCFVGLPSNPVLNLKNNSWSKYRTVFFFESGLFSHWKYCIPTNPLIDCYILIFEVQNFFSFQNQQYIELNWEENWFNCIVKLFSRTMHQKSIKEPNVMQVVNLYIDVQTSFD